MSKFSNSEMVMIVIALVLGLLVGWGIFAYERPDICKEVRNPDGELIATICGPGD